MLDSIDYKWWKFVHLAGVFGFLLTHGVSVAVLFRLRRERDRDRIRELLTFSGSTVVGMYVSLALLLVGGTIVTMQIYSFEQRWIWISILILVFVIALMLGMARPYYRRIKEAVGMRPSGVPRVSDEDLAQRLGGPTPVVIAWVGALALLAILWLMIFRPV